MKLLRRRKWELTGADSLTSGLNISLMDPGRGAFIDVGANLGVWTIQFAHRGDFVVPQSPSCNPMRLSIDSGMLVYECCGSWRSSRCGATATPSRPRFA